MTIDEVAAMSLVASFLGYCDTIPIYLFAPLIFIHVLGLQLHVFISSQSNCIKQLAWLCLIENASLRVYSMYAK